MRKRIIVKIGSSSLTSDNGGLNRERVRFFAAELASLILAGMQVLLVTSGAVAAGFGSLGYTGRPKLLHEKQASAAVGQALLMQAYQEAFAAHGVTAAQILLTRYDFSNRKRMHNASETIEELLRCSAVPIINENDTVSIDELKFGDNDKLSALVANLVRGSQLMILTDLDGLYTADPRKNPDAVRIGRVDEINDEIYRIAGGAGSAVGTGGMRTKIEAARIAAMGGIGVFIGRAAEPGDLRRAADGSGNGTYFRNSEHNLSMKKQWVGFHSEAHGKVTVDEGAQRALLERGRSLLPVGVRAVEGDFHPGDVIEVIDVYGNAVGRGVVNYATEQLRAVAGLGSEEVESRVDVSRLEVIHRDEWVPMNIIQAKE